jgi:polyketide synthase 12
MVDPVSPATAAALTAIASQVPDLATAGFASPAILTTALATGEPQIAIRSGAVLVPRLVPADAEPDRLVLPGSAEPWRVAAGDAAQAGAGLDALAAVAAPLAAAPLAAGQVRIGVRAAGLNFRDAMIGLGMYPGVASPGAEGAGVVLEVAPDVTDLVPGDRVMALIPGVIGPVAVVDRRLAAPIPAGWSFAEAATVPAVFLTAYHGLVGLAGLGAGEAVLLHAATGGVGLAGLQLARHLGAEVFATASPRKQPALFAAGLDAAHVASSRDLAFEQRFGDVLGPGRAIGVVLNTLAGDFTDASLRLQHRAPDDPAGAPGRAGRFVELGKTDLRDPHVVAADHGVDYQAFDLFDVDPDRIAGYFAALAPLFAAGVLRPLPVTAWDVRHLPRALRLLSTAGHIGKLAVTFPAPLDPGGTVLITGGTGALGALTARRLVAVHGVRHLLLASRSGAAAPGADRLKEELAGLGAEVTFAACDVHAPDQVDELLAAVPAAHPLTAVFHAAGTTGDAVLGTLTAERLHGVLRPKADAAWILHERTRDADLAAFVLYSSAAATVGTAGQGAYTCANSFLDALAARRRAEGLAATSVAWGLWAEAGGLEAKLGPADLRRLAAVGMAPMSNARGTALLDAIAGGRGLPAPAMVAADLDLGAGTGEGGDSGSDRPLILNALIKARRDRRDRVGRAATTSSAKTPAKANGAAARAEDFARDLADRPAAERRRAVLDLVRSTAAAVLGHAGPDAIRPRREFGDLGFDSLSGVELRNRLSRATGLRLATALVFEHPTPVAVAEHLVERLLPDDVAAPAGPATDSAADPAGQTAHTGTSDPTGPTGQVPMTGDELLAFLDRELGLGDGVPAVSRPHKEGDL